jgi:CBS domain-containing protein
MNNEVRFISKDVALDEVMKNLSNGKETIMPVMDNNTLIGIVDMNTILKLILVNTATQKHATIKK